MVADDGAGRARSFLSSEESFTVLKDLHAKNLLVPVVGNFAGPKALRGVAGYVRDHGALVSAFYVSNVEQYLDRNGIWGQFCANVATLPLDESSTFIKSERSGNFVPGVGLDSVLRNMVTRNEVVRHDGRRALPLQIRCAQPAAHCSTACAVAAMMPVESAGTASQLSKANNPRKAATPCKANTPRKANTQ